MTDDELDVPYGEDFHDKATAVAWADAAIRKRPWRKTIFEHFVSIVGSASVSHPRVLELGSGPGLLAEQVLERCASVGQYVLLDFSDAMLEQSRRRLESQAARIRRTILARGASWLRPTCARRLQQRPVSRSVPRLPRPLRARAGHFWLVPYYGSSDSELDRIANLYAALGCPALAACACPLAPITTCQFPSDGATGTSGRSLTCMVE